MRLELGHKREVEEISIHCGGGAMALPRFCRLLNALGPRWVVVTDGKDGAYIGTASGIRRPDF